MGPRVYRNYVSNPKVYRSYISTIKRLHLGWGLHCQNTAYLLSVSMIIDRFRRSSAAMTPVKYENDLRGLTDIFYKHRKFLTENSTNVTSAIHTPADITLESPRGWWPQESGFREVRGRDGTTISGPGSLSGVPSSRASSCGHPLWWLRLVNSHRFPVEKIKNVWLFLPKIWHRNKKFHIQTNKMRGRMMVLRRV